MLASSREGILASLRDEDLVLDVGGWAKPFARADWVLDLMPYETRGVYGESGTAEERFNAETWVARDICARVQRADNLRLVVDQVGPAKKVLAKHGWTVEEQDLLEVELADKPGALGEAAKKQGAAGVNIQHVFVGTAGARKSTLFLAVSDLKAAMKVLR